MAIEVCPHCKNKVLFTNDVCPRCNLSKNDTSAKYTDTSDQFKEEYEKSRKRRKVTIFLLLSILCYSGIAYFKKQSIVEDLRYGDIPGLSLSITSLFITFQAILYLLSRLVKFLPSIILLAAGVLINLLFAWLFKNEVSGYSHLYSNFIFFWILNNLVFVVSFIGLIKSKRAK